MGAKRIFCISREIRRSTEGDEKIEPKRTKENHRKQKETKEKTKKTQSEPKRTKDDKREPKRT